MNALISFRANALGNLNVTHKQRQDAAAAITSTYRAKVASLARQHLHTKQTDGAAAPEPSSAPPSNELGRDAFLRLLVLELQNQDPLDPVDNGEMIAQLAQFSSLEQMEKLNGGFEALAGNIDQLNFISAQGMLGTYVEGLNSGGQPITGTVNSVYLDGSIVMLNVDGQILPMSGVMSVSRAAPETAGEGNETASE